MKMKIKDYSRIGLAALVITMAPATAANAQIDLGRLLSGAGKVVQAFTISDDQIKGYVSEFIVGSDAKNQVLGTDTEYGKRLARLTAGLKDVDGQPLNFKVYNSKDVNAFACADGSVRVYTGLLDLMSDNEVLGVIGHEMGHVAHKDTKNAFKNALLTSALRDGLGATSQKVAKLTDSQLGELGEALANAKYSQKQELAADDYGYKFLKDNGKNPAAMALAFMRLKEIEDKAGTTGTNVMNQLFSSHPALADRINRMLIKSVQDGYLDEQGNVIMANDPEAQAAAAAAAAAAAKTVAPTKNATTTTTKKTTTTTKKTTTTTKKSTTTTKKATTTKKTTRK